jgi:hypothetical protein
MSPWLESFYIPLALLLHAWHPIICQNDNLPYFLMKKLINIILLNIVIVVLITVGIHFCRLLENVWNKGYVVWLNNFEKLPYTIFLPIDLSRKWFVHIVISINWFISSIISWRGSCYGTNVNTSLRCHAMMKALMFKLHNNWKNVKKRHYYFKYFSTNFRRRSVGYLIDILYADHIEKKQSFK